MKLETLQLSYRLPLATVAAVVLLAACSGDDTGTADDARGDEAAAPAASEDGADGEVGEGDADSGDGDTSGDDPAFGSDQPDPQAVEPGATIRLLTHDSFSVSDGLFDNFTLDTGIDVEVITGGDAGELVARAVLSADDPEGDVLFGIDNTFLQRGLDADLFVPYTSPGLAAVPDELELDPQHRVTPIDYGDVCVNYWVDEVDRVPISLDDLTDPALAGSFVTPDPQTSSPGFAFLLATIARYGEDGWEDYWQQLRDGGVSVTPGWSEAYYGEFIAGGGDKALVTSYGSSPVAEILFATEVMDEPPTGVLSDGCFRQIEFAGILAGSEQPDAASALIDFMLSDTYQADVPLNMFVYPANENVPLPDLYAEHAAVVEDPLVLDPSDIEANRSEWTERWAEIVLR